MRLNIDILGVIHLFLVGYVTVMFIKTMLIWFTASIGMEFIVAESPYGKIYLVSLVLDIVSLELIMVILALIIYYEIKSIKNKLDRGIIDLDHKVDETKKETIRILMSIDLHKYLQ